MGRKKGIPASNSKRARLPVTETMPSVASDSRSYSYERLGFGQVDRTLQRDRSARAAKLVGGTRLRVSGLQSFLNSPSNLFSRLRASCGKLVDAARDSNVNLCDLFVGNQMLMHVTASPMKRPKWKKPQAIIPAKANRKVTTDIIRRPVGVARSNPSRRR